MSYPVSFDGRTNDAVQGNWETLIAIEDPLGSPLEHYLGPVREGTLDVTREDTQIFGTTFPRTVEFTLATSLTMQFTGQLATLNRMIANTILGNSPSAAGEYINPGLNCLASDAYVSLFGRRTRCSELGGGVINFKLWKTIGSGTVSLGSSDDEVTFPCEFTANDDRAGDYGGSPISPYGQIYIPTQFNP
jgi:hypothetical protein